MLALDSWITIASTAGTSFVFSAAVPALLAVSASEGINILRNTPSILSTLQGERQGHPGRIGSGRRDHYTLTQRFAHPPAFCGPSSSATLKGPDPSTPVPREPPSFDIAGGERVLQDIVDEVLAQGMWITHVRRLRGQELVEVRPSIRLAFTAVLSCKERERTAAVIKATVSKVLAKRK